MDSGSRKLLAACVVGVVATACMKDAGDTAQRAGPPDSATRSAAAPRPSGPSTYVGVHYDPLPTGVSYEGGSVIMGRNGKPSSFVLSHVLTPIGRFIWLDSIVQSPANATLRTRVVRAELKLAAVASNEWLFIGSCDVNSRLDGAVVAIAEHAMGQIRHTVMHRAWRANPATNTFDPISGEKIVCEEPGAR